MKILLDMYPVNDKENAYVIDIKVQQKYGNTISDEKRILSHQMYEEMVMNNSHVDTMFDEIKQSFKRNLRGIFK